MASQNLNCLENGKNTSVSTVNKYYEIIFGEIMLIKIPLFICGFGSTKMEIHLRVSCSKYVGEQAVELFVPLLHKCHKCQRYKNGSPQLGL